MKLWKYEIKKLWKYEIIIFDFLMKYFDVWNYSLIVHQIW